MVGLRLGARVVAEAMELGLGVGLRLGAEAMI